MTDWLSQYSAALDEKDAREQAHKPCIDACMHSLNTNVVVRKHSLIML